MSAGDDKKVEQIDFRINHFIFFIIFHEKRIMDNILIHLDIDNVPMSTPRSSASNYEEFGYYDY